MTTNPPHRGVALGLQDLGERMLIDDDGPHVAFVVGILPDGRPMLWVACRSGRSDPITRYRSREETESDPGGGEPAPWTYEDLAGAGHYLDLLRMFARAMDLPSAHQRSLESIERVRDSKMISALERAAYESAHPHVCVCHRRFASQRGLAQHQRACRRWRSNSEAPDNDQSGAP